MQWTKDPKYTNVWYTTKKFGKYQYNVIVIPDISDKTIKYWVHASSGKKRKEFEIADARYAEALKIAPWWPQGHFNRALILGETERYQSAIDEMNKYLLLVPEAPDARSARDKIYEWEDLAKRKK